MLWKKGSDPLANSSDVTGFTVRSDDTETLSVSIRVLAEAVHRSGGLSGISYGLISAAVGIRTHQRFVDKLYDRYPDAQIQKEFPLSGRELIDRTLVSLSGRCDAIVIDEHQILIIEAKTYLGSADLLPSDGEVVHWAQAMLYAALYVRTYQPLLPVKVAIAYVAADTIEITLLTRLVTPQLLTDFLISSLQSWSIIAASIRQWIRQRDESGKAMSFPFPSLRAGQKQLMKEVVGVARHRQILFARAPTGIGKTMAVLYPAIKALCHHLIDRVFYLTAMTSTRKAAEKACADLRLNGLMIRSITLTAKEKICLQPDLFCDIQRCPLAIHYFDNLGNALSELLTIQAVDEDILRSVALKHQVCPFELSLDLALYGDIIICDYNYAFDPRVRLIRFFGTGDEHDLLLVDEAHNLPVRSREMFTARLSIQSLRQMAKTVKGLHAPLDRCLQSLIQYGEQLQTEMKDGLPALDRVERGVKPTDIMVSEAFRAIRTRPTSLNALIGKTTFECRTLLDSYPDLDSRRLVLDNYFAMLFFLKVTEDYDPTAYVTTYAQNDQNELEISLMCLDAADMLREQLSGHHAAVFFSATLNPMNYYQSLIIGKDARQLSECLMLPAPFPSEHLLVMRCVTFSTRFQDRTATVIAIARLIKTAVTQRTGNYLVFVPSFDYLKMIRPLLQNSLTRIDVNDHADDDSTLRIIFQKPQMIDREKAAFLNAFSRFGKRTLVGVAVIGGQFSEGIDLVGEQLSGVVIVGVGLPQICPEREIMRQYFAEKMGSGFEYAYQFPGFNRVQQAAGRVIRSETDRGFVLLIDDRFNRPDYEALFPPDWSMIDVENEADLCDQLHDFYGVT
jgi:DNA excision repair protein ERCC-2